jgi:predicted DCC family thiol-disulfide oxidoreductase YuxK
LIFLFEGISVNTEITDTMNEGWVCYDAECHLCVNSANRFRTLLAKHGFALLPLQSPAVRNTLQLPETELMAEMRVVTRQGVVLGGADALAYLSSVIFKPLFWLTRIPGAMPLLRRAYRYVARNRGCAGNTCRVVARDLTLATPPIAGTNSPSPIGWERAGVRVGLAGKKASELLPLLLLGTAAAVFGKQLPAWLYMWTLAFALFLGCKWLCFRRALARGTNASLGRKLGFLFGWIGMDAREFLANANPPVKPRARDFTVATLKIVLGASVLWIATPRALAIHPLLGGWTGMIGLVLVLHFGFFHLLSLAWRAAEVNAPPLMRAPLLSRSLGEFWGKRWNTAFNHLVANFLFRPLHRAFSARTATMLVFLASGLVHELVISIPARGGYGLPTLYFLLQGTGVLFEHTRLARRMGINGGLRGWLFTVIVTAGPVFCLFHPPFIHNVILPFLKCLGAT